jgi:pimeloyl-ACP methyl ester carboxylesterase
VLIMGLGKPLTYWGEPFLDALMERGYHVITFDNRDAGLSERFDRLGVPDLAAAFERLDAEDRRPPPYTLNDMADDAGALLEHLGVPSAHVLGMSMGGMIAQQLALRHPQRVRSLISCMSTDNPAQLPSGPVAAYVEALPPDGPRDAVIQNEVELWRADSGSNDAIFDRAYALDRVTRDYNRSHGWSGAGRHYLAVISAGDRSGLVAHIKLPVLVLHGDRDPIIPLAHGKRMAAHVPGARLMVIEGMGHSIEPKLVPEMVAVIARHIGQVEDGRGAHR